MLAKTENTNLIVCLCDNVILYLYKALSLREGIPTKQSSIYYVPFLTYYFPFTFFIGHTIIDKNNSSSLKILRDNV
jgi:hypothetical protein